MSEVEGSNYSVSILVGVKWYLNVVWICISPMANGITCLLLSNVYASSGYVNVQAELSTTYLCRGKAEMLVGSVVGKASWRKVSSLERLDLRLDLLRSSREPLPEGWREKS